MFDPSFILLYVSEPLKSAAFYGELLGSAPLESSPTFVMFKLKSGVLLGLWAKDTVEPASNPVGGSELAFTVENADRVRAVHAAWRARGVPIAQDPTQMDFGHTFVALDPDGHRLRIFARTEA